MDKFKIGDRVLPIRPDLLKERIVLPSWTPVMDKTTGMTGKVLGMNPRYITVEFHDCRFAFRKEWLKKLKRKIG